MEFRTTPIHRNPDLYFSANEYLLGDSGFSQTPNMLTPVTHRSREVFTTEDNVFNQRHSSARSIIENVFGIIKNRWGAIDPLRVRQYDRQIAYVKCAIILHNVCLRFNNDPWARARTPPQLNPQSELEQTQQPPGSTSQQAYDERRTRIVEDMMLR
jgi:hypothetical protein